MKVLSAVLIILILVFGSAPIGTNFSIATITQGGPPTLHRILSGNSGIIAVVGDYNYFLNCSKNNLNYEKVLQALKENSESIYPSCFLDNTIKTC